jgi:hypothetical protein
MSTWALYLDESGDANSHHLPVRPGETPVFTLAGAALNLSDWRSFHREYNTLKWEFFRNEIEKSSRNTAQWEFKGNRASAPRNADSVRIADFTHKTLEIVSDHGGKLFSVSFVKNHRTPTSSVTMYTKALQILAEAFDIFLRETSADSEGVIILDSRMAHCQKGAGLDYIVAISLLTYILGNEQGRQLKRIQEAPLFADSAITVGVQIADIIAAVIYANTYRLQLSPDGEELEGAYLNYTHAKRYWSHLLSLRFQSVNAYQGWHKSGFRIFDHRDRPDAADDTEVSLDDGRLE